MNVSARVALTFALVASVACLMISSQALAQGANKYNNPYISDGSFVDPPIEFDYSVNEIRNRYDKFNKRWMDHYVTENSERIVSDYQNRYKKRLPIAPGYVIRGYSFLNQLQVWSFNIGQEGTNKTFLILVGPNQEGPGSVMKLLAYTNTQANARYKRAWFGYSPVGLEAYSIKNGAY